MIKRILLENWKTHKYSELEFSAGTNVLIGRMGSGKSSVMEAICFALFGTFPALQRKEISLEEIIMNKPYENDYARVLLEFTYGKENFSVERTIFKKKASQAKLYKNGKFLAGPQVNEVNKRITELLEMDYDLFARAIYSEQNQLDYFLKLPPRERKEKFDALLGLDRYEIVRENAVKVKNKIRTLVEEKKSFLEQQKKAFNEKELNELEEKICRSDKEIKAMEKELSGMKERLSEKDAQLKEMEKKAKEYELLERLLIQTQALVSEWEKELKEFKGRDETDILKKMDDWKKKLKAVTQSCREIEEEMKKAEEEIAINKNIALNEKQLIEHLKRSHANCPICKTELSEKSRQQLLKEKEELVETILKKEKELEEVVEKMKKELKEKEETEKSIENEINNLNRELEKIKEMNKKHRELDKKKQILKESEEKIKKLGFEKKEMLELQKEFEHLNERNYSLKKNIELKKELLQEIRKQAKAINEQKEAIKKMERNIEELKECEEKMGLFIYSLQETQAQLRHILIDAINQAMQDLWNRIYPYKDYSEVKMLIEKGNYELKVKTLGKRWEKIEGVLSGGERSTVALTARIAFSLVLARNLSWLILDEPTHNLDRQTIENLSLLMREHLPELVEQVFLITHDVEMENAASANLYILNREKNEEGITKPVLANIK